MKAAAIDVGTNSVKICIAEKDPSGSINVIKESYVNARLGEGFAAKRELQPEAIERTTRAILDQVKLARELDTDAIRVVGTSAVRDATNSQALVARVFHETGLRLETMSEHDEARLSYSAVALDPDLGQYEGAQLVIDIGGGSTEFIYGDQTKMGFAVSVRAGAVRLTERFLIGEKPSAYQLLDAGTMADTLIQEVAREAHIDRLVGVGGSVLNIARIRAGISVEDTARVHGFRMSHDDLRQVTVALMSRTLDERKALVGLEPERADIILGGAVILDRILEMFAMEEMIVSTKGLRYGLLYEMLSA